MDIEAKRLDSLSRNRASQILKERHLEEWKEIRLVVHANLKAEQHILGEVIRETNTPLHVDGGDGQCEHCGQSYPCEQARKRERERIRRKETPAPKGDSQ